MHDDDDWDVGLATDLIDAVLFMGIGGWVAFAFVGTALGLIAFHFWG